MSNPYESPKTTDMEAECPTAESTTLAGVVFDGSLCVVAAASNQVATFWGCMEVRFRTDGGLVVSFLFGAAIVSLFAFMLGVFCGWLAPPRRAITLRTVALALVSLLVPASGLFLIYQSSFAHFEGLFTVLYLATILQGIGLTMVSMHSMRRWAILPVGAVMCAIGGGTIGLSYYLMIISGV